MLTNNYEFKCVYRFSIFSLSSVFWTWLNMLATVIYKTKHLIFNICNKFYLEKFLSKVLFLYCELYYVVNNIGCLKIHIRCKTILFLLVTWCFFKSRDNFSNGG